MHHIADTLWLQSWIIHTLSRTRFHLTLVSMRSEKSIKGSLYIIWGRTIAYGHSISVVLAIFSISHPSIQLSMNQCCVQVHLLAPFASLIPMNISNICSLMQRAETIINSGVSHTPFSCKDIYITHQVSPSVPSNTSTRKAVLKLYTFVSPLWSVWGNPW